MGEGRVCIVCLGMLPGQVKGFGGAMDLVPNTTQTNVVVTMEHTHKTGKTEDLEAVQFSTHG